jgi:hypothetical protein
MMEMKTKLSSDLVSGSPAHGMLELARRPWPWGAARCRCRGRVGHTAG